MAVQCLRSREMSELTSEPSARVTQSFCLLMWVLSSGRRHCFLGLPQWNRLGDTAGELGGSHRPLARHPGIRITGITVSRKARCGKFTVICVTVLGAALLARTICRASGIFFWESQERCLTDGTSPGASENQKARVSFFHICYLALWLLLFYVFPSPLCPVLSRRRNTVSSPAAQELWLEFNTTSLHVKMERLPHIFIMDPLAHWYFKPWNHSVIRRWDCQSPHLVWFNSLEMISLR